MDIRIVGPNVRADQRLDVQLEGTTRLSAEDEVRLLAAQNTQTEANSQSSRSGSVGLTFATTGISATASASRGQGQGAGNGTTFTNAQVSGETVQIESGGDTTLKGAVVQGEQVAVNVGGNLTIESQQDSSRYNESGKSAGFSVSVPITGANASVSVNAGKTNINSNYQSVNEQTAIRAGDGGFQVNVAGNTTLTGGQITSSDKAVQDGKNTFSTAGQTAAEAINSGALTLTDLNNSASFEASGVNIGVGVSRGEAKDKDGNVLRNDDGSAKLQTTPSRSIGFGSTDGSANSTTVAAISGLAGNTAARTGDAETGIKPIFNKDEVKQEVNAQIAITQEAGKRIPKAIGDQMGRKRDELNTEAEDADRAGDTEKAKTLRAEAQRYDEGGAYRNAAHAALGALAGGVDGALGAAASSAAAPTLNTIQSQLQTALQNAGMSAEASQQVVSLSTGALAATLGATAGGTAGAATAFNADMNNRQLHPDERKWAQNNAAKYRDYLEKQTGERITIEEAQQRLLSAGYAMTDDAARNTGRSDLTALSFISQNSPANLFAASASERANPLLGGNADGSWTPEQQARFGAPNVSQWANNQTAAAQRVLSSNSDCGTNVACGAGRVAAVGKAYDALEQQKALYQDNPARVAQITGQQQQLLGQLSVKDMEHAALASADADLLLNIAGLGAAPAALRGTVGLFQRLGVGTADNVAAKAGANGANPIVADESLQTSVTGKNGFTSQNAPTTGVNGGRLAAGELTGTRTPINLADDAATIRSLTRENESAATLANNGYKVQQNPPTLPNGKNPDYIINDQVFDNYAPSTGSVRNAAGVIEGKVAGGQAENVVVNLADSSITPSALRDQLTNYPIPGLKQVIIIDKSGTPTVIKFDGK